MKPSKLANGTLQLWFNPASVDGIQNLFSKDVKGKADHFGMWLSGGENLDSLSE